LLIEAHPVVAAKPSLPSEQCAQQPLHWVERLTLTNFRNYARFELDVGPAPVVLTGPNGAGKTNLMEAVSMLAAGQGLRRASYPEMAKAGGAGDWAVAGRVVTADGPVDIGTGLAAGQSHHPRAGRLVRINGESAGGSGALADLVEMVWLTPAMDGLFTGPASERRRFLDRLILCFDPGYRTRLGHFERAMASRNRLLADDVRDPARFVGIERVMAETGVAIAAARAEAVSQIAATMDVRRARDPASPFPWATLSITGTLEAELVDRPAIDVEENYARTLANARTRDRGAGRTLDGPHRSDIEVGHGPKVMPGRLCSTGEQKALLIGLVLAHAELVRQRRSGAAPILLLDEIAAHLDPDRRAALFAEILHLGAQAWMTGTDPEAFSAIRAEARFLRIDNARAEDITAPR
jgi:DNA replication and repair protein RecF